MNQNGVSHPTRQGYFQINSVRHKVSIDQNYVSWEPEGAPDLRRCVRLCDVVAVSRPAGGSRRGSAVYRVPVSPPDCTPPLTAAATCGKAFAVHYGERVGRRWKLRVQHFHQKNVGLLQPWVDQLQGMLNGLARPQRLLVLINPTCGSRRAPDIYSKKVGPIFALAGVQTDVIRTTHAGHALELLRRCSLRGYDGVVVVGGDGTLMEALNGLLTRAAADAGSPSSPLPIGVIPAGSTDAVCGSVGTSDPVTAALLIVMGVTRWVDVCSVRTAGQLLRYSLSMITYGFFGDVLQDSEKLRWLGPMRYNVAGAGRFWRSRAYRGAVMFRTAEGATEPHKPCFADCDVCQRAPAEEGERGGEQQTPSAGEWRRVNGPFLVVSSANMSCRCKITPEGMCPRAHLSDGWAHLILVRQTSRVNFLRYMYRSVTCKAPFDLPFVEYYRVKEFELLPEASGDDQRLLSEVHVNSALSVDSQAAGEWRSATPSDPDLAASSSAAAGAQAAGRRPQDSVWNCDGEVVTDPAVNLRVHPRAVRLFGRGVEPMEEAGGCCCCGKRAKKNI